MRNEPWVWLEVGDAGTSGARAVPLRSAQMMGQEKRKKKEKEAGLAGDQKNKILLLITLMWIGPSFGRLPIGVIAPVIKN